MKDFRQIFEHAPTPYMVLDRQFRYVTANRSYLEATASVWEALAGRVIFDVFPDEPDDPNRPGALMLRASLERVLATARPDTLALIPYKMPRRTADGVVLQERYWSATHTPLFDEAGQVAWILQHTEDVTELQQLRMASRHGDPGGRPREDDVEARVLRRAQRVSEEKVVLEGERKYLRQLFEQAPGFVCILRGRQYVFDIANAAYREMVGHQDLLGRPLVEVLPEVVGQGFVSLLDRVCATGEPYVGRAERMLLERDGAQVEYYLDFVYQPIQEPDGRVSGVFVLGHDVSERVRAHQDLLKHREDLEELVHQRTDELMHAEAALRQAQKMEAVGRLTGGVAHDFNNLLQVIAGNLQLLESHVGEDPIAGRRIRNAALAVERGAKLAAQLLAFARRQPLNPRPLDVARLVNGMDDMLRRTLGEAVELQTRAVDGLWPVFADPAQMENALLNLAINARDAMHGEGHLRVEARNVTVARSLSADASVPDQPGDYVLLSVSDDGGGMPADIRSQAFEPFFTTKSEGKGSGLGLSMVYGFVKQSGGHVAIDSAVGEGTTVAIYLPRADAGVVDQPLAPVPASLGGSETILVVEDDDEVRATVADLLGELGYTVRMASHGEEALAVLDAGEPVDLLFTDVVMPGPVKSRALAHEAKARRPGMAVLYTSGYPREGISHEGRLDAGIELLGKPYTRDELASAIRRVLGD